MRMRKIITQMVINKTRETIRKIKLTKKTKKRVTVIIKRNHNPKETLGNFPKSKLRVY